MASDEITVTIDLRVIATIQTGPLSQMLIVEIKVGNQTTIAQWVASASPPDGGSDIDLAA